MGIEGLPDTMLGVQVVEYNAPYKIHQIPVPQTLGPHDLLVKIAVASLCHTDSMVQSGVFSTTLPCTSSHEGAGTVVAVGSSVSPEDFKPSDRAMIGIPFHPCGHCPDCLGPEKYTQYCPNLGGHLGVTTHGCFAEYVVCDSRTLTSKLPQNVSFTTAAPLACAGATVWRGVLSADLKIGEWIAIVGSGGGLGHLGVQFAKALGLMVIGIEARDEGIELTKEAGADIIVDARIGDGEVVKKVKEVTGGMGADATINVSDASKAAATACAVTKMHGTMIQIAQPATVDIPFQELVFRDIRVHGSLVCSPDEARRMLDCVSEHRISVRKNIHHGLHEVPKMQELAHGGKMQGKAVVVVDAEQLKSERDDAV